MYLIVYIIINLNFFSVLVCFPFSSKNTQLETLQDLAHLHSNSPIVSYFVSAAFFSMAGIPPLAGFFSKFLVIFSLVSNDMFFFAIFFRTGKRS